MALNIGASWQDLALCAETDPELFFPAEGNRDGTVGRAKKICMSCEVRQECTEYAMENGIQEGVWGGKTWSERRRLMIELGYRTKFEPVVGVA